MNVDQQRLKETGEAIAKDAERIKRIMETIPPEGWAAAIASDEAKKAEAMEPITKNVDMTILGVNPQQQEQEVSHHI